MNQLLYEQLHMERGVIQELTEQERDNNLLFRVRWKGGLTLNLSYNWNCYGIFIEKDDSIFKSIQREETLICYEISLRNSHRTTPLI
ncbi:MAG: hypothetical protein K2N44_00400 [Lachnospiraceae bacterium]|nr:hypothetical protein [Lachnospiraceae bacterium]